MRKWLHLSPSLLHTHQVIPATFFKWAKPGLVLHDKCSTNLTVNDKSLNGVLRTLCTWMCLKRGHNVFAKRLYIIAIFVI